mgnify:CR=1 FL=1
MVMSEFAAVTSSVNAAVQMGKALLELKTDAAVGAQFLKLNQELNRASTEVSQLISAQTAANTRIHELVKENLSLKEDLSRICKFRDEEKSAHVLVPVGAGACVYVAKPHDGVADDPGQSLPGAPWLCANCFDGSVKSILQPGRPPPGAKMYVCHRCKGEIVIPYESAGMTIESTGPRRRNLDDYTG